MVLVPSISASFFPIKPRIRISNIELPLKNNKININYSFDIIVTITNRKFISKDIELHSYLSIAGIRLNEIGKTDKSIKIPARNEETFTIECNINQTDIANCQEKYEIIVVLYVNTLGFLVEKNSYTTPPFQVITETSELDKLKIINFNPQDVWKWDVNPIIPDLQKSENAKGTKTGNVLVTIQNDAEYEYSVIIRVDIVEKAAINIPLVGEVFEIRKEIGRINKIIPSHSIIKDEEIYCELKDADQKKLELDLQAVLIAEINGELVEVDKSTIQTIQIDIQDIFELIKFSGPWIWILVIAGISTYILILATIKVILPLIKFKPKELELRKIDLDLKQKELDLKLNRLKRNQNKKKKK